MNDHIEALKLIGRGLVLMLMYSGSAALVIFVFYLLPETAVIIIGVTILAGLFFLVVYVSALEEVRSRKDRH